MVVVSALPNKGFLSIFMVRGSGRLIDIYASKICLDLPQYAHFQYQIDESVFVCACFGQSFVTNV